MRDDSGHFGYGDMKWRTDVSGGGEKRLIFRTEKRIFLGGGFLRLSRMTLGFRNSRALAHAESACPGCSGLGCRTVLDGTLRQSTTVAKQG